MVTKHPTNMACSPYTGTSGDPVQNINLWDSVCVKYFKYQITDRSQVG